MPVKEGTIVYFYNQANTLHIAKVSKVIGEVVHLADCCLKVGGQFVKLQDHLKAYKVKMPDTLTEDLCNVSIIDSDYLDDAMSIYFPDKEVYKNRN